MFHQKEKELAEMSDSAYRLTFFAFGLIKLAKDEA